MKLPHSKITPRRLLATSLLFAGFALATSSTHLAAQEYLNGIKWEKPPIVDPGSSDTAPPADAIVLFDGSDASAWLNADKWTIGDGNLVTGKGQITTKDSFGDCQLHIEWSAPTPAKGSGQGRGNSGIFMMGRYEIQVLDSYDNETYHDGQAGAIYKQTPPMVNAMRPPGEWNTYDIFWTAPRFAEDGSLTSPAYVTAVHNGVLILNHFALLGDTPYNRPPRYTAHPPTGPISLQDHGNPVRFRNIWLREIKPIQGEQVRDPFLRQGDKEIPLPKTDE
ncbi:3-keto-disaccharide hydrolase [Planctomycetaceae bacterium SH139]